MTCSRDPHTFCLGVFCPCEDGHEGPFERCYCSCHGDPRENVRRTDWELAS